MDDQGFTLVELLVVGVVVFGLIGGITLVLAQSGNRIWGRTEAELTNMTNARTALSRIGQDVRLASQACFAVCGADALSLARKSDDVCDEATRVTFTRDAGTRQLRRTPAGQAAQVMAGGLTGFAPICQPNGLIRIQVTVDGPAGRSQAAPYALESQIFAQNP